MLVYLLLVIVFGLLTLAAIGLLIVGLIKKKKNVLVISAILFLTGTVGCVFSAISYTKEAIAYVKSDVFQDDAKKGSVLAGKTMGSVSSGLSEGVASTLDDEAIQKLAGKSATILGRSIKTIASGLDSTIGNKYVFIDKSLENSGLETGRAEEKSHSNTNDLEIFIDYKKDFIGTIRITNYDQSGKKIEAVDKAINVKAGQGRVEVFNFTHSNMGLTTYYIISSVHE
jgi:ABC-type transport system involved in multi-copper enzyme maturation permease subunit